MHPVTCAISSRGMDNNGTQVCKTFSIPSTVEQVSALDSVSHLSFKNVKISLSKIDFIIYHLAIGCVENIVSNTFSK